MPVLPPHHPLHTDQRDDAGPGVGGLPGGAWVPGGALSGRGPGVPRYAAGRPPREGNLGPGSPGAGPAGRGGGGDQSSLCCHQSALPQPPKGVSVLKKAGKPPAAVHPLSGPAGRAPGRHALLPPSGPLREVPLRTVRRLVPGSGGGAVRQHPAV